MKIQSSQSTVYVGTNFKGLAKNAPKRRIYDAVDAISQWKIMKHPQFSEIFQEEEVGVTNYLIKQNKQIRNSNYSFLDELKNDYQIAKFIEHFKKLTGFPNLEASSRKIREEFSNVLKLANENLFFKFREKPYNWSWINESEKNKFINNTVLSGYDKFCSVGLGSALPGSDLDKGFAIIKGVEGGYMAQKNFVDAFNQEIWNNIDNRIMSVNHVAAFPNIRTDKQLAGDLANLDNYARKFVDYDTINAYRYLRMYNGNPISGSKFNIFLSQMIPNTPTKYEAKNIAYLVEAIRDGQWLDFQEHLYDDLYNTIQGSYFCHCSNVTQSYKMQERYDYAGTDIVKKKLKARQEMERQFDYLPIKEQYEVVKDVIRSMSGDNKNPDYKDLFYSPPDKHRLLINDILRGKVDCAFDPLPNNGERTTLFFRDPEVAEKYHNLNVYNTNF